MPELPEVETSCRGIAPYILNQKVSDIIIRQKQLRWPIPSSLSKNLVNQTIHGVERRAKYILLLSDCGTVILHLGMSGSLHIVDKTVAAEKHDHLDICFQNKILRFRDPRRFGCVLFTKKDPLKHKLLCNLGPEPLSQDFYAEYLFKLSKNRHVAIKNFIMNSHIVVGVGNIYASESLFLAGINPKRSANNISLKRYILLVSCIKQILQQAIKQGGTTLRDFTREDGRPGYFQQSLAVYGRALEPCLHCGKAIHKITQGQRSTYYCRNCQK